MSLSGTRGVLTPARRSVVRDIVSQQRTSVVCLQESKIAAYDVSLNLDLVGSDFDFAYLPAVGAAGGAITTWRRDLWSASDVSVRRFSVTIRLAPTNGSGPSWWLTNVYGPT